ncbi:zinc-dependent peptidase [Flavobacterium wongokense]|uniref:zinc-dependent peptidase n=1 Tax=Flavobacterium wongokense TaxID=2910674 RepID=UPI001F434B06|nr:zinc-dependent peptidase [Flavobacterium sp. WG47]MCF6130964.1 zinc-dependent peptidase [Flavobacterium sp. WG47]
MEIVFIIFLLAITAAIVYSGMFFISLLDDISIALFNRPLYIHLYFRPKKVSPEQEYLLRQKFRFYQKLNDKQKIYFHHRLACFIEKYQFIPLEDFVVTQEVETLIAATYVMLTFGMRQYLVDAFDKIIIYPEKYLSTQSQEYYKGEFNPKMKAIVFSWKDFREGYEIDNDNLNLGIHEFSHAVHCHSMQSNDASSLTFKKYYTQLSKEVNYEPNKQKLINSDYFRIYAYTNSYEFISVMIEHYFETPIEFRSKFPKLYQNVSRMLNHKP